MSGSHSVRRPYCNIIMSVSRRNPSVRNNRRAGCIAMSFSAVILAAGRATRLGAAAAVTPKAMLPFAGLPFLTHLTNKLVRDGCSEIVVVVGHLAPVIERHVANLAEGCTISTVRQEGDGTGAALLSGVVALKNPQPFLSVNADTILDVRLAALIDLHIKKSAEVTIVVTELVDVPNPGAITVDASSRIVRFSEDARDETLPGRKPSPAPGLRSNCGYYCFDHRAFRTAVDSMRERASLENDIIPAFVRRGHAYAFDNGARLFHDFGTRDRLSAALRMQEDIRGIYLP
jgi:NDP-sugar pyrophosphorylase family protein